MLTFGFRVYSIIILCAAEGNSQIMGVVVDVVVQWNLYNPATHVPGFIGRNSEVAGVHC